MSDTSVAEKITISKSTEEKNLGIRKSGKQWKEIKTPQRIRSKGVSSNWQQREKERQDRTILKAQQQQVLDEAKEERQEKIKRIKDRQQEKADKERYARLAEKMSKKRIDRLKRREKRNKLLKER
ncbi:hypothetical protein V1514DRAFT_338147 [Lipomyces japonicus]|uniref:uncharacterized protein n=1 Tax=Lipomyces japonicus TaxID=56871 RepID=UPI0034CEABDE